jgi:hypothetical protein
MIKKQSLKVPAPADSASESENAPKYGTCKLCGGQGGAHLTTCVYSPTQRAATTCTPAVDEPPSKLALAIDAALQAEIEKSGAANVIQNRLGHARATLDLIATMTSYTDCDDLHLESLDKATLNYALHGAIRQIDEAVEAAKAVHHG